MTIGSWNGYTFVVSPSLIRGFEGLTIKGSCETKDKTKSKQKYVKRKAGQPTEISLTVQLNALTGVTNVRTEAIDLVSVSKKGTSAYFYIGKSKLVPSKVMLVSASVENVDMVGTTWATCNVKLTLKQSGKDSGGSSSSGKKKSKKKSVKKKGTTSKKTTTSTTKETAAKKVVAAVKSVAKKAVDTAKKISKAVKTTWSNIKSQVSSAVKKATAQKTTATKKVTTTGRNCTFTNNKIIRIAKPMKINLNLV